MAAFTSRTYEVPYTLRPISDRTAFLGRPASGDRDPFRKSTWTGEGGTQALLARELFMLTAVRVVLELDVLERHIRKDGGLRGDASLASTAVRLSFETADGPLVFATDRFGWDYYDRPKVQGWQDNVRAIALGLEALRKVNRYGITQRREQYRGFLALEAGGGLAPTGMTTELARKVLADESRLPMPGSLSLAELHREARRLSHPDMRHGDRSAWDAVEQAAAVLRRNGLLS